MHWLILPYDFDVKSTEDSGYVVNLRIKFFLNVLNARPALKTVVIDQMTKTIQMLLDFSFFTEIGMDERSSFLQEISERLSRVVMPNAVFKHDLKAFAQSAFDDGEQTELWKNIDAQHMGILFELCSQSKEFVPTVWRNQIEESVLFLIVQIQADAFSEHFRERLLMSNILQSSFFQLNRIATLITGNRHALQVHEITEIDLLVQACRNDLEKVIATYDSAGASQTLILQVERIKHQLTRTQKLVYFLTYDFGASSWTNRAVFVMYFVQDVVTSLRARASITHFLSKNLSFIIQKIIRVNVEIGDHYIARTQKQLKSIFVYACGGGIITVATVFVKVLIAHIGFVGFFGGLINSLNYAISFFAIQYFHFTLATKQPASTAAVIAKELDQPKESFRHTLRMMIYTQLISVAGNLVAVIPLAFVLFFILQKIFYIQIIDVNKASAILQSTNILGPSILFAIYTGILLFIASLIGGWFANWIVYRKFADRIRINHRIRKNLGPSRAEKLAQFFHNNSAALATNLSLGFLLGMTPEVMQFFSIPIEVRHVTLASGTLASAVATLNSDIFSSFLLWKAILGILIIGLLNLLVSFGLSLFLAMRSKA